MIEYFIIIKIIILKSAIPQEVSSFKTENLSILVFAMTNIRSVLSYNMKSRRKVLGLSQIDLAEKTGSAANYISKIEAGRQFPSVEMIEKLADALQIDTVELFALSGQQKSRMQLEKSALMQRISNEIDLFIEKIDPAKPE